MSTLQYVYRVTNVVRIIDGDTYWLTLDVGLRHAATVNIRLSGYDTPEVNSGSLHEKATGLIAAATAKDWLTKWVATPNPVWVRTEKDPDSFGRWLGTIWVENGSLLYFLGKALRDEGLASVWPTRWKDEYEKEDEA